jgi:uncharacterized protein (DUF1778 family)
MYMSGFDTPNDGKADVPLRGRGESEEGKMTAVARREDSRSSMISLRVPVQRRELIDRAAKVTGKTRTEFILESAGRAAEDALLDQRIFHLDEERYQAFLAALDAPPRPEVIAKLRKLLAKPAPWER